MKSKQEAVAEVHASRAELQKTLEAFKARVSPPQLAEDAMNLLDPELTLLGRIKSGVQQNRLLSLAVLAGVGWLVGAPRRSTGEQRRTPEADTASSRATLKENKNDSGKDSGDEWPVSGSAEEQGSEVRRAKGRSKAQNGGIPPLGEQQHGHALGKERFAEEPQR